MVTVIGPSGFTQTVSITQFSSLHDVQGPAFYRTRNAAGVTTNDPTVNQPLSVRALLGDLTPAIDPSAVTQVYLDNPSATRPNAHTTPLTPADLGPAGSNGFENGLMPAVYDDGNNTIGYIRPLRAGDPTDANTTNDYLQGSPGQPIRMTVRMVGKLLLPQISVTPGSVSVGQKAQLGVTFAGNPDTTGWTYLWDFGDGSSPATGPNPRKSWTSASTYDVTVHVRAPDSSSGQATVPVTVTGPVHPSPSPTQGTGGGSNSNPNAPHHGPQQGHGSTTGQTPSTRAGSPSSAGTPHPVPTQPLPAASGDVAVRTVTGTVLVGANGTTALADGTGSHVTLDLAAAGARSTRPGPWTWSWALLVPLLLLLGAVAELRPWTRRRLAP